MSLEAKVEVLEIKHSTLDESVHGLVRVVADIKKIAIGNRDRLDLQDRKIDSLIRGQDDLGRGLTALAEATLAGFKRIDERHEEIKERFDRQDKRFDQQDKRFDQHDKRFDRQDKRFDELELLIRQLIPNSTN